MNRSRCCLGCGLGLAQRTTRWGPDPPRPRGSFGGWPPAVQFFVRILCPLVKRRYYSVWVDGGGLCSVWSACKMLVHCRVCCRSWCLTVMDSWRLKWHKQLRFMSTDCRPVRRQSTTWRLSLPSSWLCTNASLKMECWMTSAMRSDRLFLVKNIVFSVRDGPNVVFMSDWLQLFLVWLVDWEIMCSHQLCKQKEALNSSEISQTIKLHIELLVKYRVVVVKCTHTPI